MIRIPEGAISGDVVLQVGDGAGHTGASNALDLRVAVPMAEGLHPVANPAVDADGNVYATVSGARGQSVPVSIYSIARDFQVRPFVRDLLNATGLAFDADGYLYVSSRAEGTVYRISPAVRCRPTRRGWALRPGLRSTATATCMWATGRERSSRWGRKGSRAWTAEIFVYATLEPSIAAYHLAFNDEGTLFVTGPTTSSNQSVYAIDRDGHTTVYYQGLGRAQGMAFDVAGNLYVAASLRGQRGIVRITPGREASLAVSGNNLVGLAFLEDGCAALATKDALYHVALDIEGRRLV